MLLFYQSFHIENIDVNSMKPLTESIVILLRKIVTVLSKISYLLRAASISKYLLLSYFANFCNI